MGENGKMWGKMLGWGGKTAGAQGRNEKVGGGTMTLAFESSRLWQDVCRDIVRPFSDVAI